MIGLGQQKQIKSNDFEIVNSRNGKDTISSEDPRPLNPGSSVMVVVNVDDPHTLPSVCPRPRCCSHTIVELPNGGFTW